MIMSVDENIDTLGVFKHIDRTVRCRTADAPQMAETHDRRATLCLEFVDLLLGTAVEVFARRKAQSGDVFRTRFRLGLGCRKSENAHLHPIFEPEDGVSLREGFTACIDGDVGRQNREVSLRDELFEVVGSPVELVVADRHRVIP